MRRLSKSFNARGWRSGMYCLLVVGMPHHTAADTPLGWLNNSSSSAYTATRGEIELSVAALAVNESLDVFGFRDDLIGATDRLEGKSGDLSGKRLELNYGVTRDVAVFYRQQQHSLTLDFGQFNSIDVVDIDRSLDSKAESAGLKWTFYRANLLNSDNRVSAATLELAAHRNDSANFDVVIDEIRLEDLTIFFGIPQTFSVANLEDNGWSARLRYSWPLGSKATGTLWAGLGESEASSATTSDLSSATLKRFFEQRFELEESYLYLGASLRTELTPRTSLELDYEFISITESKFERFPAQAAVQLPGFFAATGAPTTDKNHIVKSRLAYWLTPSVNLSVFGNLFANQFVGVLPHYNNPLSGSFTTVPYGFAGMELTYKLGGIP